MMTTTEATEWTPGRILALLERRGWTHQELADRVGVARVTITAWINGHNPVTRPMAILLSHIDKSTS